MKLANLEYQEKSALLTKPNKRPEIKMLNSKYFGLQNIVMDVRTQDGFQNDASVAIFLECRKWCIEMCRLGSYWEHDFENQKQQNIVNFPKRFIKLFQHMHQLQKRLPSMNGMLILPTYNGIRLFKMVIRRELILMAN